MFRLSADPAPAEPPPAGPLHVREIFTSAYARQLATQLAERAAELAGARRTIEAMARQQTGDKNTITELNNDIADLTRRNAELSQRLHAARQTTTGSGRSGPGTDDPVTIATLQARLRELTDGNNAQANIIAHYEAAAAGRAPVRLGGWAKC